MIHSKRVRNIIVLYSIVATLLLSGAWSQAPSQTTAANQKQVTVTIGPRYMHVPVGYFVLVRKGAHIGAFRLIDARQDSKGLGESHYESFFGTSLENLTAPQSARRTGTITTKPLRGFLHSFMWQPGQDRMEVGDWSFGCLSPTLVNMSGGFSEDDEGYEFAPTGITDVRQLMAAANKQHWFRYDSNNRVELNVAP